MLSLLVQKIIGRHGFCEFVDADSAKLGVHANLYECCEKPLFSFFAIAKKGKNDHLSEHTKAGLFTDSGSDDSEGEVGARTGNGRAVEKTVPLQGSSKAIIFACIIPTPYQEAHDVCLDRIRGNADPFYNIVSWKLGSVGESRPDNLHTALFHY